MTSEDSRIDSINFILKTDEVCGDPEILKVKSITTTPNSKRFSDLITKAGNIYNNTSELVENINSVLAATDSNRYYRGAEAQKRINDMKRVVELFQDLKNVASNVDSDDVNKIITDYNRKLKAKKDYCRKKLLHEAFEAYNNERHVNIRSYAYTVGYAKTVNEDIVDGEGYIIGKYESGDAYELPHAGNDDERNYEWATDVYKLDYNVIRYKSFADDIPQMERILLSLGKSLPYGPVAN